MNKGNDMFAVRFLVDGSLKKQRNQLKFGSIPSKNGLQTHSFSQNSPGPLTVPAKHPQNIHPSLRGSRSTTQSGWYSSPARLVTQVLVCLPDFTHVSSVHSILFHCSLVQSLCASAQATRSLRFFFGDWWFLSGNSPMITYRFVSKR